MKKLALAVTVLAFGAFMIAGCPEANTQGNKANDAKKECGDECTGDECTGDEE